MGWRSTSLQEHIRIPPRNFGRNVATCIKNRTNHLQHFLSLCCMSLSMIPLSPCPPPLGNCGFPKPPLSGNSELFYSRKGSLQGLGFVGEVSGEAALQGTKKLEKRHAKKDQNWEVDAMSCCRQHPLPSISCRMRIARLMRSPDRIPEKLET